MRTGSAMMRRGTVVALAGLLLVSLAATASAHETREVEGEFEFVVGFMNEPAYVNEMNGLDLRISYLNGNGETHDDDDHDNGEADDQYATDADPVENAHQMLQAQIQFAGETKELELRPVWGQPGAYTADIIPTETGAYSFQITGEIDGVEINESFTAGPDSFSEIEPKDELEFPATSAEVAGTDQAAAIAIAGVVAGLLGLAIGGAALYKVTNSGELSPAQRRREARRSQQSTEEG